MRSFLRLLSFTSDLILLNLSIFLSYTLLGRAILNEEKANSIYLFLFSNMAWMFLVLVANPYVRQKTWGVKKVIKSQVSFVFIHVLVTLSLSFFFHKSYEVRQLAIIYALFIPFFLFTKFMAVYTGNLLSPTRRMINAVVVGNRAMIDDIAQYFRDNRDAIYSIVASYPTNEGVPVVNDIEEFCRSNNVHIIYCGVSSLPQPDVKRLVNFGLNDLITVKLLSDRRAYQSSGLQIDDEISYQFNDHAVIPLDDRRNQWIKRTFDFVFAVLTISFLLSWIVPIISLLIVLDSRGPVFFSQKRSGRGNKPFNCLKFRTMRVNQDSDTRQATRDDTRITKLGAFLRKTSIDELPQFFNVLTGSMSVVGPRPHMLKHTEEYSKLIDRFMARHYIKPGITGLAQCMGYRGETKTVTEMRNRVKLDRLYIETWTLMLDVKIIFLTVVGIIRGSDKAF